MWVQSVVRSQSKILSDHRKRGVSAASDSSVVTVTVRTNGTRGKKLGGLG